MIAVLTRDWDSFRRLKGLLESLKDPNVSLEERKTVVDPLLNCPPCLIVRCSDGGGHERRLARWIKRRAEEMKISCEVRVR